MNIIQTFIIVIAFLFMLGIALAHYRKDKINDKD